MSLNYGLLYNVHRGGLVLNAVSSDVLIHGLAEVV